MPASLITCNQNTRYVTSVYLDANFLIDARNRLSSRYQVAARILGDLIVQGIRIHISTLVLDEVWYILLKVWYRALTGNQFDPRTVKQNPQMLTPFPRLIRRSTEKLLRVPNLTVLSPPQPPSVIRTAMRIFDSERLMPRDCFHLALTLTHGVEGFITRDRDFDNLSLLGDTLNVYKY